jgi:predicted amidophosphoribosyltransferase
MRRRRFVVLDEEGPGCPRCGRPMQVREHDRIRAKQLHQPYYFQRWYYCTYANCRTTIVTAEEFKVWNQNPKAETMRRLEQIK